MSQLVSIIIPIYNVEAYIKRCLDSVTSQTYQNLEIIAVDDGSNDRSVDICDECASADHRIRVIRKANEGAGFARNTGIDEAHGDYIFFLDSDDYILDICVERLVSVAESEDADIVKCSWVAGGDDDYDTYPEKKEFSVYSNVSAFRTRKMNIAIPGKLFRRQVIGDLRYPKVTVHDDEFFTYKLIYNARKIIILDEAYYYYYMSPNSIMRGKKKKQPLEYMRAYEERIVFFTDKKEPELVGISHKEFAIRAMLSYLDYGKYESSDMSEDELLYLFRKEYTQGKRYAGTFKERVSMRIFSLSPRMTRLIAAR